MKKIIAILLLLFLVQTQVFAIELSAGTPVHVQPKTKIDADKVKEGDSVEFIVMTPVREENKIAIKAGTVVVGQVTKKKNNFILGVPGEIEIGNFKIYEKENEIIGLRGFVSDEGENRYWVHFGWFFLFPLLFIKGDDGKIPKNMNYVLYTIEDMKL